MIIKCNDNQKKEVLDYIGEEYGKCLYLYIDLVKYGCESEFVKVWKVIGDDGVTMVMLAYHSALHLYSIKLNFDLQEIIPFINEIKPSIICATKPLIEKIKDELSKHEYVAEYGHIGKKTRIVPPKDDYTVQIAALDDINQIAKLLYEDDDIGASYTFDDLVVQIRERLTQGFVRSFVITQNGKVVAHLGTGAETERLCTISYVITDPNYRGKGLSSSLFGYACRQLENEGKEIFSVYYPENSRRLHHKMGFEDYCEFGKLFKTIQ